MAKDQQAFPSDNWIEHFPGMTLRDYFAAKAMQGILSDKIYIDKLLNVSDTSDEFHIFFAQDAFRFADSMLKEREKQS